MTMFGVNSFQFKNLDGKAFELMDNTDKLTYVVFDSETPGLDIPEEKEKDLYGFLGAVIDEKYGYGSMPCDSKFQLKLTIMDQVNVY